VTAGPVLHKPAIERRQLNCGIIRPCPFHFEDLRFRIFCALEVFLIEKTGVLKIEQDNQNTYRTSEYSFGELRMRGVHIHYVRCAQIHRYLFKT
jgi:hypothetical protein